jgi:predicted DNA-binding transcriptional regulator
MILPNPLSAPLHFPIAFSIPLDLIIKVVLAYYIIAFEKNLKNVKVNIELEALNLRIVSLVIFSNALVSSDHLLKSAWIGSFETGKLPTSSMELVYSTVIKSISRTRAIIEMSFIRKNQ